MNAKEKTRRAVVAQVGKARARANATVDGNARAILDYYRSGNASHIPDGVTLADTMAAGVAVREEDFALAGFDPDRLPGLRAVVLALGAPSISSALEYIAGKRKGASWKGNDADGLRVRLGLAAVAK
jgi:hypothetical protein